MQNRTDAPAKWLEANRKAIHNVLRLVNSRQTTFYQQFCFASKIAQYRFLSRGASDSAGDVMDELNEDPTTRPIFGHYRSLILFHGRSMLKSQAEINYGLAPSEIGFDLVEYSENGFFAHNWKLFMFL